MGVYEGRGQLSKQMKLLLMRWSETRSEWDDANAEQFERTFLQPMEMDLRSATSAMDQMAVLIGQIKRDCE
jgi:hypothetical protein